jgi:hypothetical protein
MPKNEKTSLKVASTASAILRSTSSTKTERSVAGSALSQAGAGRITSTTVATKASKTLDSTRTSPASKSVAGSVLTQKVKR